MGLVMGLLSGIAGCGGTPSASGGPQLRAEHLPELLRFVEFGEISPEHVQAQFTADNLYVTSSVGRELQVRARGPNTGRQYAYVHVTRRTDANGYIGALGDEFTLRFGFTNFEPEGPLRLFSVEVTQPLTAPNVCEAAQALAAGEGLVGCHEQSVYRPAAPDAEGYFHACVSDPAGHPVEVRCASSAGHNRAL